ncbi:MAG: hypothetical protein GY737_20425, partial [Desulfobacteraceae bacterium]|nr:hypothetical protein [Desulfobacteraceae bacterium]
MAQATDAELELLKESFPSSIETFPAEARKGREEETVIAEPRVMIVGAASTNEEQKSQLDARAPEFIPSFRSRQRLQPSPRARLPVTLPLNEVDPVVHPLPPRRLGGWHYRALSASTSVLPLPRLDQFNPLSIHYRVPPETMGPNSTREFFQGYQNGVRVTAAEGRETVLLCRQKWEEELVKTKESLQPRKPTRQEQSEKQRQDMTVLVEFLEKAEAGRVTDVPPRLLRLMIEFIRRYTGKVTGKPTIKAVGHLGTQTTPKPRKVKPSPRVSPKQRDAPEDPWERPPQKWFGEGTLVMVTSRRWLEKERYMGPYKVVFEERRNVTVERATFNDDGTWSTRGYPTCF